jgi:hypothetical protein
MNWLRPRRPSPALVVSIIALIVALGGTGYAAVTLPKNSVGTKQLKKKAVTNSKIRSNAVTGSKVKNDSLTGKDIRESTLGKVPNAHHADIADNATSATNAGHASNADNATNATTANQLGSLDYRVSSTFDNPAHTQDFVELPCGPGEHVLSGGVVTSSTDVNGQQVAGSYPSDGTGTGNIGTTAWVAGVNNESPIDELFAVTAICAKAASVSMTFRPAAAQRLRLRR